MFNNGITPEAIPERVYLLCKSLVNKRLDSDLLHDSFEPVIVNNDRSYFGYVKRAAIDLGLIRENENKELEYCEDIGIVSNLEKFRMYCNSVIWKDKDSLFFKMAAALLASNDKFLSVKNLNDSLVLQYVQNACNDNNADIKQMRGIRFWLEFLGLGYIQEKNYIYFLPNMYTALKDFINASSLEKNVEYSVRDFIDNIQKVSKLPLENSSNKMSLNLAFSNALRLMDNHKEIKLEKNLDSKETWTLFNSDVHDFGNSITHILYKGIK